MKKKVYIETTIPSYLVSKPSKDIIVAARQQITWDWWENYRDEYELFTSQEVIDEASDGNEEYAKYRYETLVCIPQLPPTEEVERLATVYFTHFSFPTNALRDAVHLAFAVYYELDYLLTWNCKHLANASIRPKLYKLNNSLGYQTPDVCTPEELIPMEE